MNGILFARPDLWGKAWSLYRRQTGTDSYGDPTAVYDMDSPDFTAEAGSSGAVAWQQSSGSADVAEAGEAEGGTAAGVVYDSTLELAPFDRVIFDDALWEVTTVTTWPNCRRVEVKRIWA